MLMTEIVQINRIKIGEKCSTVFKNTMHDTVRSNELLAKLEDLDLILRERRLLWFGHVEHSCGAIRTACDIQIDGRREQGGPS